MLSVYSATILPSTISLQTLPLPKVDQWHSRIGWPPHSVAAQDPQWEGLRISNAKLERGI